MAEENNKLIDHIMLNKCYISNSSYKTETLFLGPISVILEYHNKGIGSRLINKSFELVKSMGDKSIVFVETLLIIVDSDLENILV